MILHKAVQLTNGWRVDVEDYSRGGTDSPHLYVFIHNGKRYLPYHQDKLALEFTLSGMLKMVYEQHLPEMVYASNPLLMRIPKDGFSGRYVPVPIKFLGGT